MLLLLYIEGYSIYIGTASIYALTAGVYFYFYNILSEGKSNSNNWLDLYIQHTGSRAAS